MENIISVREFTPFVPENCFLADNCRIIGDVKMGENCSIWFNAVIRGDVNSIVIGENVNIQDGVVIHGTYEKAATFIGDNSSVGHNAIVHGATISDRVLVGMGSIIMDNAFIEENVIIGAGAVIPQNFHCESGYIYAGVPAKKIKEIDQETLQFYIDRTAQNYIKYASWFG